MSHILTGLISCPEVQKELDANFVSCDPTKFTEPLSLVQFLTSPVNTSNILQQAVTPGQGKRRTVTLTYTPRVRENEVAENVDGVICTSDKQSGMLSTSYEVDCSQNVSIDEAFDADALATVCKSNDLYFAERLQANINALLRKLETKLTSDLVPLVGNFAAGENDVANAIKTVQTKYSDGKPNTNLLEEVTFAAMNAGYCTQPYLLGWGEAWKYFKRLQAGCCADSGLALNEMLTLNQMTIAPSYRIQDTFGTNDFISMAAGAAQLLNFNLFEGAENINFINQGSHKRMVLRDPLTGLGIDTLFNFPCDGTLTVHMKICYKLVGMPTDLFSVGDRLSGVTQINRFRITNP